MKAKLANHQTCIDCEFLDDDQQSINAGEQCVGMSRLRVESVSRIIVTAADQARLQV